LIAFLTRPRSGNYPFHRSWGRTDLDGDNKPGLYFAGSFARQEYEPHTAMIYISSGDSYKLIPVVHRGRTSFRPHIFIKRQKRRPVIVVHNYYFSEFEKVETLLESQELSRETCAGDDTLMCNFGPVLDYSSHPSNIMFDSLVLLRRYGWSCNIDSFTIYKNGAGRYGSGCSSWNYRGKEFQASNISYLRHLIQTSDLKRVPRHPTYGGIDTDAATLKIYHYGKEEEFFDYGLEASFTWKAIYKYFKELQREL
jgi:hypothetical protein